MKWTEHIVSDQKVLLGKPVIKGTRLSVEHIVGLFAQGWSEQEILENYPRLKPTDLQALFSYLQDSIHDGLIQYPIRQSA